MNQRLNDALSTLSTSETEEKPKGWMDTIKGLLGGTAIAAVAGKMGGTAGVNAVGGFFQNRAAQEKQRRLEKINQAKRIIDAERSRADLEQSAQAVAESKDRVLQRKQDAQATADWRKGTLANQSSRDLMAAGNKALATVKDFFKPAGGGSGRSGAPTMPKPPTAPIGGDVEKRKRDFQVYAEGLASNLIGPEQGKVRSLEELNAIMPQVLELDEIKRLAPDEQGWVIQEMKRRAGSMSNPDLVRKSIEFEKNPSDPKTGFTAPPPATMNTTMPVASGVGAVLGGTAGGMIGPWGVPVGAGAGAMIGGEIGRQFPDAFQMPGNVGQGTKDSLAEYIKRKYGRASGGAR
jgi:hypothetical protein